VSDITFLCIILSMPRVPPCARTEGGSMPVCALEKAEIEGATRQCAAVVRAQLVQRCYRVGPERAK